MSRSVEGYPEKALTERIIGAAYEVHHELGSGFLEKVYETALFRELASKGIHCEPRAEIKVSYKGAPVGVYFADLLVDSKACAIIASGAPGTAAQLLEGYRLQGRAPHQLWIDARASKEACVLIFKKSVPICVHLWLN